MLIAWTKAMLLIWNQIIHEVGILVNVSSAFICTPTLNYGMLFDKKLYIYIYIYTETPEA